MQFTEKQQAVSYEIITGLFPVEIIGININNTIREKYKMKVYDEEPNYSGTMTDNNTLDVTSYTRLQLFFKVKNPITKEVQIQSSSSIIKETQKAFANNGVISRVFVDGYGNKVSVECDENGSVGDEDITNAFTKYSMYDFEGKPRKTNIKLDLENVRPFYEGEDLIHAIWTNFYTEYLRQEHIEAINNSDFSIFEILEGKKTDLYCGLNKKNNEFCEVYPALGKNRIKFYLFPTKGKPKKFNAIHPNALKPVTATDLLENYTPDDMDDIDDSMI